MVPILAVGFGGFIGAVLRYLLSLTGQRFSITFPHGTLWANFLGCLLLGMVTAIAVDTESLSPAARLFLATGICGGFTTMSTFTYEMFRFLQDAQYFYAAAYFSATIAGCGLLFGTGLIITKLMLKA
ncbi:MAG TPA: fluoride efflux transporter CrcB [Kiritimatiellia bacterium]|nr:fluoride efflux transporter CrcB [Kiritimatiellia bacterium]HNR94060.1 fluoride efflux transporter CrcB [Kiritimatiellia bacterium]HNS81993.1 fluoride efflux transporter CrcB [Kiritimatiellia bacterium]HPA78039.1 fluoride efflux transporter CrcB [Kiritimatiellia bacterium]HQQ04139.1 fluoride efflux transporter CrcB [Kiritimatiellia bacterium]